MNAAPRFSIIFILGIGHSGSTLLGRMLNRHPDVLCPGELLRLEDALADPSSPCSCGAPLKLCDVWDRRLQALPAEVKSNYTGWTARLLEAMADREGAKVLVDLSKTRAYRLSRKWRDPRTGYIFLTRDPRGALRSHAVKGGDLKERVKIHKKWTNRLARFERTVGDRGLSLHYEDLVTDPRGLLRAVCDHIGLAFSEDMLAPGDGEHHFVRSSTSSYRKGQNTLILDERWRKELASDQLRLIEKTLGALPAYAGRYFND